MAVVTLQRVADGTGVLAPQERALKLPAGWTIVDHPQDSLVGTLGGDGQVTGYLELVPPAASVVPITGTLTTTDTNTHVVPALLAIPTGTDVVVVLDVYMSVVTGAHAGDVWYARFSQLWVNPSGTPIAVSMAAPNSSGPSGAAVLLETDTSSGAIVGGSFALAWVFAPASAQLSVTGYAAETIHWSVVITPSSFRR